MLYSYWSNEVQILMHKTRRVDGLLLCKQLIMGEFSDPSPCPETEKGDFYSQDIGSLVFRHPPCPAPIYTHVVSNACTHIFCDRSEDWEGSRDCGR